MLSCHIHFDFSQKIKVHMLLCFGCAQNKFVPVYAMKTSALGGSEWSTADPEPLYPRKQLVCCLGPSAILHVLEKRQISWLCRQSNPRPSGP